MLKFPAGVMGMALASTVAIGSACAADILAAERDSLKDGAEYGQAMSWTGFYLGSHIGGAFGRVTDVDRFPPTPRGSQTKSDTDAAVWGGTIGYNRQHGSVVIGVEADVGAMNLNDAKPLTRTTKNSWAGINDGLYGDVTGRLGYARNRTLVYVKGGFAFYDGEGTFGTKSLYYLSHNSADTFTGMTVGSGIEYSVSRALSLKAEYQYFNFGTETLTALTAFGPVRFDEELSAHTVKVGLNYHFNRDHEPLK